MGLGCSTILLEPIRPKSYYYSKKKYDHTWGHWVPRDLSRSSKDDVIDWWNLNIIAGGIPIFPNIWKKTSEILASKNPRLNGKWPEVQQKLAYLGWREVTFSHPDYD